ncbi:hypothetical protein BMS3Bbin01_02063 [bacterium BMS3Bbin01]|nr:hypothetical protein BMS3Bbin01_02063 [bacterium BMS3Bbin01]
MNHGNVRVFVYGSLVSEPRQFKDHISRESFQSWFNVEYARCSSSRMGGPTVVPYDEGWPVEGELWELDLSASSDLDAATRLFAKVERAPSTRNIVQGCVGDYPVVLYAAFPANIPEECGRLTPQLLARLAIRSVQLLDADSDKNGIRYLRKAKARGILTPLTDLYVEAVLALTGTEDLQDAEREARHVRLEGSGCCT